MTQADNQLVQYLIGWNGDGQRIIGATSLVNRFMVSGQMGLVKEGVTFIGKEEDVGQISAAVEALNPDPSKPAYFFKSAPHEVLTI